MGDKTQRGEPGNRFYPFSFFADSAPSIMEPTTRGSN
jgi:hypothetical protein